MKITLWTFTIIIVFYGLACTKNDIKPANTTAAKTTAPAMTPDGSKDGNYNGKGTVTKIDEKVGSVGLDHENIEGLMPAMQMEFYVTDKALLNGLTVGDKVDFVIEYKRGTEKVSRIDKTK